MPDIAKLIINGKTYELPIVVGTEGEKAIESMIRFKESGGLWLVDPFTLEQIPVPMNGHISLERHQLMFIRI